MTDVTFVDSTKCPHCQADVSGSELRGMEVTDAQAVPLVCPEYETILESSIGDGGISSVLSLLLAHDIEDFRQLPHAMSGFTKADSPEEMDDDDPELINERQANTAQVSCPACGLCAYHPIAANVTSEFGLDPFH